MYRRTIYLLASLLTLCLCTGVTVADLQEGLVSHWKLDEGAGNIAYDSAGTSHGQLYGIANWMEGYLNEGVGFREGHQNGTGSVGYIACNTGPEYDRITNAITLSCWVLPNPDAVGVQNWVFMIFRSGSYNESFHLAWRKNQRDIRFRTTLLDANSQADTGHFGASSESLFDGGWHHVAGTYDGLTKIIYLDGEEIGRTEIVGTFETAGTGRVLMNCTRDVETPNCGAEVLEDMRVYDRALSATEVAELAGAVQVFTGKATDPTPIDLSTFEETSVLLKWWSGRRAEEDWAKSDRVYLSTNRDAVENSDASVKIGEPEITELEVQDLIPGSTYYWRVDEVYADGQVIPGYIWQFSIISKKATAPVPAEGTLYADPNILLSWAAGFGATSHAVHVGTDQAAVTNAVTGDGVPVTEPNHFPGPLAADTTYYWRVDEIGAGGSVVGDVWSLTVGPDIPVTDPNLVGYWKLDETPDDFIIDDSGHHHHGQVMGSPALVPGLTGGNALEFSGQKNQFCKLGTWLPSSQDDNLTVALRVKWAGPTGASQGLIAKRDTWTNSMWTLWAQENGQIVFEISKDTLLSETMAVDTWEHWAVTFDGGTAVVYRDGLQVSSGVQPSFPNNPTTNLVLGAMDFIGDAGRNPFNGALDDVRLYNKVLTAAEIQQIFRTDLNQAWNPVPGAKAVELALGQNTVLLSWSPGEQAAQHKVLFGSDPNALVELGTVSEPSIVSPVVDLNSTHFWQVNEINTDGTVTEGPVWQLNIADIVFVDDFEDYDDDNSVWFTWQDGFGWKDPAPGSTGNGTGSFVDFNDTAVSGAYSMSITYDNTGTAMNALDEPIPATISEVQHTWASPQDLTQGGYNALVLSFRGNPGNAPTPLYVRLEGVGQPAVIYHEFPDAMVLANEWREWAIELAGITTGDLTAVTKMVVGVGDASAAGGSGALLVDQIMLANRQFAAPGPVGTTSFSPNPPTENIMVSNPTVYTAKNYRISDSYKSGQTFTPANDFTLGAVTLYQRPGRDAQGNPYPVGAEVTLDVYTGWSSDTVTDGTLVGSATFSMAGLSFLGGEYVTFTLLPEQTSAIGTLSANTEYALVLGSNQPDSGGRIFIARSDNSDDYPGGEAVANSAIKAGNDMTFYIQAP